MPDTILVITAIYSDGTSDRRAARIAPDGHCQLRINFHAGRIGRGQLVKPIRFAAAASPRSGLKPVTGAEASAAASSSSTEEGAPCTER